MAVIQIRKAERAGSRLVFAFAGWTGEGKTYTAIQFGYGLAGYDATKVGLVDAENKRGSLLADILEKATRPTKERFLVGDLYPPFSPARYGMAVDDMQAAGVEVCIIDSVTHEWEGIGGCQDIAEAGNPKIPRWDLAKGEHKKFMQKLLQSDMHIIVCVRAREKTKPEKKGGKTEFVDYGLQPIQEKNFMFEVTGSVMMFEQGRRQRIIKVPESLLNVIGRQEGYITADEGYAVRQWVMGAIKLDPHVEKYRSRLQSNTEGGIEHIEGCWKMTPPQIQEALGQAFYATLIEAAKGFEEHQKIRADDNSGEGAGANKIEQAEADAIAKTARNNGSAAAAMMGAAQQTASQPAEGTASARPAPATATPAQTPAPTPPAAQKPPEKPPMQQTLAGGAGSDPLPGDPVF